MNSTEKQVAPKKKTVTEWNYCNVTSSAQIIMEVVLPASKYKRYGNVVTMLRK